VTDAQGETALHAAVRASNTSAARQLMVAGADARARSLRRETTRGSGWAATGTATTAAVQVVAWHSGWGA
jgi:ankyrin repeat protein